MKVETRKHFRPVASGFTPFSVFGNIIFKPPVSVMTMCPVKVCTKYEALYFHLIDYFSYNFALHASLKTISITWPVVMIAIQYFTLFL